MRISPRACRYCGSPAMRNPCWYYLKYKNVDPKCGGDLPCWDDLEYSTPRRHRWIYGWLGFALLIGGAALVDWLSR